MSTPSLTRFLDHGEVSAAVYHHYDGYPQGHGAELLRCLRLAGALGGDPSGLAARLVVYLGRLHRRPNGHPLDFLSVGVASAATAGRLAVDYRYEVDLSRTEEDGLPRVVARCGEPGRVVDLSAVRRQVLAEPLVDLWAAEPEGDGR